jgi:hypothetical protein
VSTSTTQLRVTEVVSEINDADVAVWYTDRELEAVCAYRSSVCEPVSEECATDSTSDRASASTSWGAIGGYGAGGYAATSTMLDARLDGGLDVGCAGNVREVRAFERACSSLVSVSTSISCRTCSESVGSSARTV